MSYDPEYGIIQLGAEAWPSGMRGHPEAFWVSRPRRPSTQRLLFTALVVLCLSFGALYVIGQAPAFAYAPLALAFQP